MQAARDAAIPVPRVHATYTTPECTALLLDWVPGRPLLPDLLEHPDRVHRRAVQFGRMQGRIHAVKAPGELEAVGRSWIDWAEPDDELRERLEALDLRHDALLHLDYNVMNVMTDGATITGVIDWTNSGVGDPRADLARTFAMMWLGASPPDIPAGELEAARRLLAEGWKLGYREVAGPMGDLSIFFVWAGTVMLRDLPQHLGKPGVPLRQEDLDQIEEWTQAQRRRLGLHEAAH
jgi:aminoglycoside phosphotransferase (APT) family kinase protein